MNHVPLSWLRWLRIALIVYGLHFIVGYFVFTLVLDAGGEATRTFTLPVVIIATIQMCYEVITRVFTLKASAWVLTLVSYSFALLMSFISVETSGEYKSPYFLLILVLVFLGGMLGSFIAPGVIFILILGFVLAITGFFGQEQNTMFGVAIVAAAVVLAVLAHLIWKRFYIIRGTNTSKIASLLHQEQLKSNLILNAIGDGVALIDNQNTIQLFNAAAAQITGWDVKELVGLDFRSVLKLIDDKGATYSEDKNPFAQALKTAKTVRDDHAILLTKSEQQIAIDISVSPLLDENNNVSGAVAIFRDVSQHRREEQQRAEFISTASHEMRTPVAAIEGYLALAMNDKVASIDTKARDFLEKAHSSTQHLGKLFQDLLTSAKAEDGRLSSHPQVVDMSALLEQVTDGLRFAASKKNLLVNYTLGAGSDGSPQVAGGKVIQPLYFVVADPDRMREVITNLFDNAVKYTDKGKISIGLTGNNEVVQLFIRDTGGGIPAEDVPHLFQKFYRVDNSATRIVGGTGLGLFICRKIVELYNGRVWVESKLNEGSTFYINLPRISNQKAAELQAKQAESQLEQISSLSSS